MVDVVNKYSARNKRKRIT